MFWRVQTAWSGGLHPTFMGREEALAKRDVERILRTWTLKNLMRVSTMYMAQGRHVAFAMQAKLAADSVARLLEAGNVWAAYDAFHAFQDSMAEEFEVPIWFVMGTIIVEAPQGKGPKTRKRFITEEEFPKELPPGFEVVEMEGTRLGALRRWTVSWGDFGGERHPSYHMREADAMAHLAALLEMQAEKLHQHASTEAMFAREPERKEYAEDGIQLVFEIRALLAAGKVWDAYVRYKEFEEEFRHVFDIPLDMAIGTVHAEAE